MFIGRLRRFLGPVIASIAKQPRLLPSGLLRYARNDKFTGITLVEMLIALAVNVMVLSALVGIFASNMSHYNKVINSDRLNQQLQTAMRLMSNDIRRAGYWLNAKNDVGLPQNTNPFMAAGVDISTPSSNCILFAYDYNGDGSLPAISNTADDERYGYRLNGQVLQTRPWGAPFSCTAATSTWENVTDPTVVRITNLSFTITTTNVPIGATSSYVVIRSVDISLSGQLVSDATVAKTLTQHIRVRNDKYVP